MPIGGLRLRMPQRSARYALYHPAPDLIELRFLAPGLAGKTIVIDAGHGGPETGAVGLGGTMEKNVNLAVALKLQPLLVQAGARVILVRTTDSQSLTLERSQALVTLSERTRADLENRVAMSNAAGADLYLSIHANGGPGAETGRETYWAVPSLNAAQSRRLAGLVQGELLRGCSGRSSGTSNPEAVTSKVADLLVRCQEIDQVFLMECERGPGREQASGAFRTPLAYLSKRYK